MLRTFGSEAAAKAFMDELSQQIHSALEEVYERHPATTDVTFLLGLMEVFVSLSVRTDKALYVQNRDGVVEPFSEMLVQYHRYLLDKYRKKPN